MIYYTIYIKNLSNGTGYIDVALDDDQLLKDYLQFLDIGMKAHRSYRVVNAAGAKGASGLFSLNLSDVSAITTINPG
jgi:hypothetical protein